MTSLNSTRAAIPARPMILSRILCFRAVAVLMLAAIISKIFFGLFPPEASVYERSLAWVGIGVNGIILLLCGLARPCRRRWIAVACTMLVLALYSLLMVMIGAPTCGCLGRVAIDPWWSFWFNTGVVGILILLCPPKGE